MLKSHRLSIARLHLTGWLRTAGYLLATGYILFFYSELLFWARPRPSDSGTDWLYTWLAYSLAGYAFLAALIHFRVQDKWGLYLCGALFGWLTEGVIVQTMYASFPLQISWTGLAWHALISVWLGWYGLPRALRANRPVRTALLAGAIGLFWGLWALWWWVETPESIAGLGAFSAFAAIASLLLVAAYAVTSWLASAAWAPSVRAMSLAAILFGLWFALVAVPAAPLAALVLPPLLLLLYLALHRQRAATPASSLLAPPGAAIRRSSYLALLSMPAAACAVYAAGLAVDARLYSGWLVYAVTTPLGFIMLAVSLARAWRQR